MKRILAVFLTVILITVLFGCAGLSASVDGDQTSPANDPAGALTANGPGDQGSERIPGTETHCRMRRETDRSL